MRKEIIIATLILFLPNLSIAGDAERGKALFSDPSFGNGTNGKTCLTCHEEGLDLDMNLMEKRDFEVMGVRVKDPADAVNFCIEVTLRGEGLDPQHKDMRDMLSWLTILAPSSQGRKYKP